MSEQDFANHSSYYFEDVYARGKQAGWNECLASVKASLQDYPNVGGDVGIMAEVDRLRALSYAQGKKEGCIALMNAVHVQLKPLEEEIKEIEEGLAKKC